MQHFRWQPLTSFPSLNHARNKSDFAPLFCQPASTKCVHPVPRPVCPFIVIFCCLLSLVHCLNCIFYVSIVLQLLPKWRMNISTIREAQLPQRNSTAAMSNSCFLRTSLPLNSPKWDHNFLGGGGIFFQRQIKKIEGADAYITVHVVK